MVCCVVQTRMKKVTLDVVQTAHERLLTDTRARKDGELVQAAAGAEEVSGGDASPDSDAATVTTSPGDATDAHEAIDAHEATDSEKRVILTQEDPCVHEYCKLPCSHALFQIESLVLLTGVKCSICCCFL